MQSLEKTNRARSIDILDIIGRISSSKSEIAKYIHNYFQDLYSTSTKEHTKPPLIYPKGSNGKKYNTLTKLSKEEVRAYIMKKLPDDKTPGPSGLTVEFYESLQS